MPNSWHKAVEDFSPRLAVTTKLTRCSRTSIVFHGIDQYAPALAALAPECKGCLETFRKGSHGTEQLFVKVGTHQTARFFSAAWSRRSRVTSSAPKYKAVAAIIRSGMSGTATREIPRTARATPASNGVIAKLPVASVRASSKLCSAAEGNRPRSAR